MSKAPPDRHNGGVNRHSCSDQASFMTGGYYLVDAAIPRSKARRA